MELKVSIIIPTFNRSALLKEAIESALAQTYSNLEIIVADNASTDNTPAVAAGYAHDPRFRYFRNSANIGMVRNWRKALLDYAAGDWFLILSDDDLLLDPGYIEEAAKLIGEFPETVLVYADGYRRIGAADTPLGLSFDRFQSGKKVFLTRDTVGPQDFMLCNVLFHRKLAVKLGAFLNEHNIACDSELFLKMCLSGGVGFINKPVSVYRIHDNNLIQNYNRNPDMLINHIEWFIQSYKMAVEGKFFTADELALWRRRVVIGQLITLYKFIIIRHRKDFLSMTRALIKKSGISAREFVYINLVVLAHIALKLARLPWRWGSSLLRARQAGKHKPL